jgi:hypothetical protein
MPHTPIRVYALWFRFGDGKILGSSGMHQQLEYMIIGRIGK